MKAKLFGMVAIAFAAAVTLIAPSAAEPSPRCFADADFRDALRQAAEQAKGALIKEYDNSQGNFQVFAANHAWITFQNFLDPNPGAGSFRRQSGGFLQ
jgi:hypothetical protein